MVKFLFDIASNRNKNVLKNKKCYMHYYEESCKVDIYRCLYSVNRRMYYGGHIRTANILVYSHICMHNYGGSYAGDNNHALDIICRFKLNDPLENQ